MAWNLPGKGGSDKDGKDPWRSREPDRDTDAFLERLKQGVGRLFGGEPGDGDTGPRFGLWIGIAVAVWVAFGSFSVVGENQRGVVLRFGQFDRILMPGVNLKWPWPVESVTPVDTASVRAASDSVRMVTSDQSIVQIDYNVQYTVSNPRLFSASRDPEKTVQMAAESVLCEMVGITTMDDLLKGQVAMRKAGARERLQAALDRYQTGLRVADFTLQSAQAPQEVKDAFDDLAKARQEKDKAINAAKVSAADLPKARGDAATLVARAQGYKEEVIANAQGSADHFALLAEQYHKAPEVTRRRMYLETMETVLKNVPKVVAGRGITIYLTPARAGDGSAVADVAPAVNLPAVTATVPPAAEDSLRADRGDRSGRSDGREVGRR